MSGLGDRLEEVVRAAHAEVGYRPDAGFGVYVAELQCAIRELDGQRHALREERDHAVNSIIEAFRILDALPGDDIQAAAQDSIAQRDALVATVSGLTRERDAAIERAEKAERECKWALGQRDAYHVDREKAEARVRELEAKIKRMREAAERQNFMTRWGFL